VSEFLKKSQFFLCFYAKKSPLRDEKQRLITAVCPPRFFYRIGLNSFIHASNEPSAGMFSPAFSETFCRT